MIYFFTGLYHQNNINNVKYSGVWGFGTLYIIVISINKIS